MGRSALIVKKAAGPKPGRGEDATSFAEPRRPLQVYIQGLLPSLKRTERLIAEYILADPERVLSSAIAEMREASGASVGSIVSFCRKLGLKGFADFKIALARDLAEKEFSIFGPEGPDAQNASLFEKVFHFHAESLIETWRINRHETLREAARAIETARRVECFAVGMSYPTAYLATCKFRLIGLPVSIQFDSHMQMIAATQLRKGDLAFGISCSGQTPEVVHCMEIAKSKGATTMCLTNSVKSAIATISDCALFATPSEIKYFQAPLASRITQLAVVDALFVSLACKYRDRTALRLQNAAEELLRQRLV